MEKINKKYIPKFQIQSLISPRQIEFAFLAALLLFSFIILIRLNVVQIQSQYFIEFAKSFLKGRLDLSVDLGYPDFSYFNGKIYSPHGLLPSLILVPLVWMWKGLNNVGYIFPFFNLANFLIFYQIMKRRGLQTNTVLWLCLAFFVISPYFFVGSFAITWQMLLGTTFVLLALLEYSGKKRPLILGAFVALAGLCRFTLFLTAVFFVLEILLRDELLTLRLKILARLALPLLFGVGVLFGYNYLRFGDIRETGYSYMHWTETGETLVPKYGFFNPRYIPKNIYYNIFNPPQFVKDFHQIKFSEEGVGIIIISPYLVWLVTRRKFWKEDLLIILTVAIILIPNLSWFSSGATQFSFRFALDFLPLLFLFLANNLKEKIPVSFKILLILGFFWNLYLYYSFIGKFLII